MDERVRDAVEHKYRIKFIQLKRKLTTLEKKQKTNPRVYNNVPCTRQVFHQRTVNFSSVTFTKEETNLLEKGLKYAPNILTTKNALKQLAADTENILQFIHSRSIPLPSPIRIIDSFKQSTRHFNNNFAIPSSLKTIREKIKTHNLVITKADKGNCTVIMDRSEYIIKTNTFLNDNGLKILNNSPLNLYKENLKAALRSCPDFCEYFERSPSSFIATNTSVPQLYSLPKIHKPLIPVRPIVPLSRL